MRFWVIIAAALLLSLGLTGLAGYFLVPTIIFNGLGTEGVHNRWVQLDPLPRSLLYVPTFSTTIVPDDAWQGTINLWKKYRFRDFNFLFPVNHPNYRLVPALEEREGHYDPGLEFIDDYNHQVLFKIRPTTFTTVHWPQDGQALFRLPAVQQLLQAMDPAQWWHDVWTMDLRPKKWRELWRQRQRPLSWGDLAYALFVAQCRQEFFPEVKHLSFDPEKNLGLASLERPDNLFIHERLYAFAENNFYLLDWQMRLGNLSAESFREHLLQEIEFAPRRPDDVFTLYDAFTELPYAKKISEEGATFLYLAWSYDLNQENYLRSLVHYLEKSKDGMYFLAPLYTYIHRVYGDKFISMHDLQKAEAAAKAQALAKAQDEELAKLRQEEDTSNLPPAERIKKVIENAKKQWQHNQQIRTWQKD